MNKVNYIRMDYIKIYDNVLTSELCNSIIKKVENNISDFFEIPKRNKEWDRIEKFLYKQILIYLKNYKKEIIFDNISNSLMFLNNDLYVKRFLIQRYKNDSNLIYYQKESNRYCVMSFIFFLNTVNGGEIIFQNGKVVKPNKCNLLLFNEDINNQYKFNNPEKEDIQYIISGQIYTKIN